MKNYVGFVNDHSGSMRSIANAAKNDYNNNIQAIKDAASKEMLDTIVSVVALGYPENTQITRQVVISNPHVLKPITDWKTNGYTPLYDAIADMIELFRKLPDALNPDVSFLVMITTDGEEYGSKHYTKAAISDLIKTLQNTGRWTFVCRIPKGMHHCFYGLGIPAKNIQEWETNTKGMEQVSMQTTQAINSYYSARAAGSKSSTTFFADASQVDVNKLQDVTKEISLYKIGDDQMGILIEDFVLTKRAQYLKGAAFYQLTKTEPRISRDKLILIRDRSTGKFYAGDDARKMINLPLHTNARLHPGDHGNYDIFIQSESLNRKLVAGTGLAYWPVKGTEVTQADRDRYKPADTTVTKPAVLELPQVTPTNKPTPSPIPKVKRAPMVDGKPVSFFLTREDARSIMRGLNKPVRDGRKYNVQGPNGERWFAFI